MPISRHSNMALFVPEDIADTYVITGLVKLPLIHKLRTAFVVAEYFIIEIEH